MNISFKNENIINIVQKIIMMAIISMNVILKLIIATMRMTIIMKLII